MLVLLISASVATLSSITLTACSTLSMDLVKDRIRPQIKDQNLAMLTRLLCLFFVVGSYLVANYPTPILEMMSYSWGIISGSFLAPYMISLYWKKINRIGAWAGMLGGFCTSFIPVALSGFKTPDGHHLLPALPCLSPYFCALSSVFLLQNSNGRAVKKILRFTQRMKPFRYGSKIRENFLRLYLFFIKRCKIYILFVPLVHTCYFGNKVPYLCGGKGCEEYAERI